MGRTVVTRRDVQRRRTGSMSTNGPAPENPDTYRDRLIKYIPTEVVAIYLAELGVVKVADPTQIPIVTVEWVLFGVTLLVSVIWQRRVMKVAKWQQVAIGTVAFFLWALSRGSPFDESWGGWYRPLYGTMLMMFFTFLIPLFEAEK